jgi:hypothetical protein
MQNAAPVDPLVTLHETYARRDRKLAACAYGDQAEVVYRYDGAPGEPFRGTRQIEESFAHLGPATNSIFKAGLADGEQFHPGLFTELAKFARIN